MDSEMQELRKFLSEINTRLARIEGGVGNQTRVCGLCQESIHALNLELHHPITGYQPRLLKIETHVGLVREIERRAWVTLKDCTAAGIGAAVGAIVTVAAMLALGRL